MKTILLTRQLFSFIILFSLILLSNGCDDDGGDNNSCSTFLECQDDTVWEGQIDLFLYFKINNNLNNPVEIYLQEDDCYYHSPINETTFEIMENSKNTLKIKIMDDSDDSFKRMVEAMANELPFRALVMLSGGAMPIGRAEGLLDMMNRKPIRGIYKIVKG